MDPIGLVGAAAGIMALPAAWATWRVYAREEPRASFAETRQHLNGQPDRVRSLVRQAAPNHWFVEGFPVIAKPDWLFAPPVPLDAIQLVFAPSNTADRQKPGRWKRRRSLSWSYSSALLREPGKDQLFNGYIYRPVSVATTSAGLRITCDIGRYFDYLDHGEVLAYELAARDLSGRRRPAAGPRRKAIKDPFDFGQRPTSLGINTLTIRRGPGASSFIMHRRGGARIVNEFDLVHVTPAGEFAPSSYAYESFDRDFSLWRNIQREYAEELLGMEDVAGGQAGRSLDYSQPPFCDLDRARAGGQLHVAVLALIVDPLFMKPELLTVCVIDAPIFDDIFAAKVVHNAEGTILAGDDGLGIPFSESAVATYAGHPGTTSSACTCLNLAWRHRTLLGI